MYPPDTTKVLPSIFMLTANFRFYNENVKGQRCEDGPGRVSRVVEPSLFVSMPYILTLRDRVLE